MGTDFVEPLAIELLDATTLLEERPFTHPAHSLEDLRALHRSVGRLRAALHCGLLAGDGPLLRYAWEDEGGQAQRIILKAGAAALLCAPLTVVGFFGQRRRQADPGPMEETDRALVDELADHDELLAYYTAALPNGDYGNLVLCAGDAARVRWNRSPRHADAVRTLAPSSYYSIRLHNGLMAHGLRCSAGPVFTCTKYYDYSGPAPWRAMRTFVPPLALGAE